MDQQLDLDSFLNSHSTDSDSDSNSVPHRTLDEILNDSDSDTSPSLPNSQTRPLTSLNGGPSIESLDSLKRSQSQSLDDIKFEQSKPPSFTRASSIGFLGDTTRRAQSTSSAATISSSNRPLPSLFGGVRSTSKPGAALAAATAASRSIPTPYAAAIKSRRVNQKVLDVRESSFSSGGGDNGDAVSNSSIDESIGIGTERSGSVDRHLEVNENVEGSVSPSDEKLQGEVEVSCQAEASMYGSLNTSIAESNFNLNLDSGFTNLRSDDIKDENEVLVSELDDSKLLDVDNESSETDLSHLPAIGTNENDGEDSIVAPLEEDNELEKDVDSYEGDETNIGTSAVDDVSSMSDISELVEERIEQLESEMISRREEKKRKSTMKPLESAEELEKKQASTGLHWEEGAAAQPMKLEGVRRGSTTLGYFDINADNLLTRTIVSQTFRRDYGSPQVVAVHLNYIAVGMTKGVIVVVPSRYSPHNDDSMDTKMLMLGLQGDRSNAAVTSMCFNHQGDLLLAGYGDGRVTVWDVQRVSAAKVITGEHNAPVVHTLFLGQDSQATRQFKAVTGDSKGLVLLHAFSVVPLLNRFSIKTQCLLDGQRTGTVLSASPLLFDDSSGGSLLSSHGNGAPSSSSIGSMMGGVVGGDSGWKLFNEGSSLIEEGIVIFVTHQTALVVRLTPSLEVYAQLSRPDGVREGSMPYTAWKYVTQSQGLTIEPVERVALLAIAWDRKVQLAKLVKSELKVYGKWSLDSAAIGVAWLDAHMLVVLTTTGQLCLFASDGTVIHQTSFGVNGSGGDDLAVYHTHFINIYGNPEKSYHNCLGVRGASLYILGPMHLIVARLLPWKERIQVLRRAGDWMGALNMAMTLYDGQAHGVIDLPRSVDAVKEVIMPYLVELLLAFVDEGFSYISVAFCNQVGKVDQHDDSKPGSDSVRMEIKEQFTRVGGVAVEFCVHIQRTDILFDEIFSKFIAVQHRDTFLELLEPYILKDMLGSLPPEIMQALVEHYSSKGWLQRVEQCVLHMDISSLDFNQVVRLCREHGLYGALVYLFNKGLNDFRAPLEELLVASQNSPREAAIALGYRTLVYLKYCFSGLAFPPGHGSLPPTCLPVLRKELVEFLLETPKAARNLSLERNYLNLHYLLSMDTEATLDVLKFAFMDGENQKPEFLPHESDNLNAETKRENNLMADNQTVLVQNTINALVQIIEDGTSQESGFVANEGSKFSKAWPSDKDLGNLFEFIADHVACGKAHISSGMLSRILEYLTSESIYSPSGMAYANETPRRKEKKVIALLETVSVTDWSAPYVLQLCEKAFFHQVCGLIHTMRHDHLAALDSFMKDVDEPIHTFCYINSTLQELSDNEYNAFRSTVMSRIPELAILSREGTFLLVIDNFSEEAPHILAELRPHPKSLFLYLKTIIEVHLSGKLDFSKLSKNESLDVCKGTVKDQLKGLESYLERLSDFPKFIRNNPVHLSDDMIELYLELLCQFERDSVLKFLETFDSYRVEHCLRLCQEYGIIDAAAFLLERVGDVGNALSLILSGLNDKFVELDAAVKRAAPRKTPNGSTSKEPYSTVLKSKEVEDIRSTLHSCIELCQRNTPRLQPEESETHWFRLLDSFCQPLMDVYADKRTSKDKNRARKFAAALESMEGGETLIIKWKIPKSHKDAYILRKLFSQFIKEIVEGMIGYVRLPTIMSKLLSDNCGQEFGDFKFTILGMLGTYGFERRILDTAKSLIEDDTFYTMSLLKKGASHGYAPRSLVCCMCNCLLSKNASSPHIRVFNCGHATHLHCELLVSESSSGVSLPGCPICMPKKNSERQKSKLLLSESGLVNQVSRRPQRQHGTMVLHPHEDPHEYTYGSQQISRFEILHNLQKAQKLIQIEHTPILKLAPPAVYHDKIKKRSVPLTGETSSGLTKVDKSAKAKEGKELKAKGPSLRFPLKSSIFGKEVVLPNRKNNNNLR